MLHRVERVVGDNGEPLIQQRTVELARVHLDDDFRRLAALHSGGLHRGRNCLTISINTADNQLVYAENTSTETEILDGNGAVAVKLINDYGISENTITAVIYDTGRYSLQLGDAEGFMQGIPNLPDDLKITVTLPDGTSTQLNKPDYMMRGDTGYWYYDIEIMDRQLN